MCRTVQQIRGFWNLWKHDYAYSQWAESTLGKPIVKTKLNTCHHLWSLWSLSWYGYIYSPPIWRIRETLLLTLHITLCIIVTERESTMYKCWLMLPCGDISSSLPPTTATISVFPNEEREEQRKRQSILQPRFFHWRETVFLGWTTEAIFSICLLQQGCATALTWEMAFWETLTPKDSWQPWLRQHSWQKKALTIIKLTVICGT